MTLIIDEDRRHSHVSHIGRELVLEPRVRARGDSHVPHVGRELVLEPRVLDDVGDGAALVGVWDQDLSGKCGNMNEVWRMLGRGHGLQICCCSQPSPTHPLEQVCSPRHLLQRPLGQQQLALRAVLYHDHDAGAARADLLRRHKWVDAKQDDEQHLQGEGQR